MDDDEARKFALDSAAVFMRGAPFTEVLEAARAFHAFLVAETHMPIADAKKYAADVLSDLPPPIPHQDLGKADQSPLLDTFRRSVVLASTAEGDLVIDDDAKTRIVRPVA